MGVGGETPVQRLTLCHWQSVDKGFYRWREGTTCRNSAVSSDGHHEIGHCSLTSVTLIVSRPFIFSSRVGLFPFPWGHFSELCLLMSWLQSAPHVVHFSTWGFRLYNRAHSIWLRITSIALEEELRVLGEEDDRALLHFSLAYKLRGWPPTASLPGTSQWRLKQHWFSWSSKRCYVGWKHSQGQWAQTSILNGKCQRNWRLHFKIDVNI